MHWKSVIPMPHNVVRLWIVMHSFTDNNNNNKHNLIYSLHPQFTIQMKVISLHCRNKQRTQLFKSWLSDDVRSFYYTIVSSIYLARQIGSSSEWKMWNKIEAIVWSLVCTKLGVELTEISTEPKWKLFHSRFEFDAKCECLRDFNYYILTFIHFIVKQKVLNMLHTAIYRSAPSHLIYICLNDVAF